MSLVISHNTTALQAHRNLGLSASGMTKAIEKLSSGFKINVGADDPSGLIISEQLRSQISGLERAVRNSSEAFNLIGIAEGALNEMNTILKKMRALAIHAASNGVTSPEQIAADQSEMDSGIATLNRIADTTRYSDQYLLNGSKQLVYDDHTLVDEPTDHQLLDTKMTRVDQIFKREGVSISIGYAGDESVHKTNTENSAKRAYLEADNAHNLCQIDGDVLTADQEFTLTGTSGARMFNFTKGEHIGKVVSNINNSRDSTGIGATLTFASNARIDNTSTGFVLDASNNACAIQMTNSYVKGQVQVYGAALNTSRPKVTSIQVTGDASESFRVGYNTDGDAKIYAKVIDVASGAIEYYKDKECTMLVGKGNDETFSPANNSGIPGAPIDNTSGIFLDIDKNNAKNLDVYEIVLAGQNMDNEKDMFVDGLNGFCDIANAVVSGVDLGKNTSAEAQIFFNYRPLTFNADGSVATFQMDAYTDGSFEPKYLVGTSGEVAVDVAGNLTQSLRIESVPTGSDRKGPQSGLNMTMNIPLPGSVPFEMPRAEQSGTVQFTNLGLRVYSTEYGSQETIRIQNNKGSLLYQYRSHDNDEKLMIEPDTTVQVAGGDARITVNGSPIYTTGLIANTTTPDFSGMLAFNGGGLGKCTIAVTGYGDGRLYAKSGDLQGVEENEVKIEQQTRTFEPASLYIGGDNRPTPPDPKVPSVYIDFSGLDPKAESRLAYPLTGTTPTPPGAIEIVTATPATKTGGTGLVEFTINGLGPDGTAGTTYKSSALDYEDMEKGVYLAEPEALKGVFVKLAHTDGPAANDANAAVSFGPGTPMIEVNTYATQPRGTTSEEMSNFLGGMQFQLGNTEGDQDRTIYSIPSMAMSNLGRIDWNGEEYNLQSVLGGGKAALSKDPVLAMRILAQAVDDVSTLRARLGAFQSNMLQTNINSLNVAVENITKTESAIRDTDMAAESTQMTRYQIMQQAGTSMLAQANQSSQNVLSLLQ